MAVKIGAPADSPLRTFVIRPKGTHANTADNDKIVNHDAVAIKRRMDDYKTAQERKSICKEAWDD